MKALKRSLKSVSNELLKAADKIDKLAQSLDGQMSGAAKPAKKAAARPIKKVAAKPAPKRPSKKSAKQPTAAATVLSIVTRSRNGVNVAAIKKKTGYNDRKIHNIVYKLKKQEKIKSQTKGVYVKA